MAKRIIDSTVILPHLIADSVIGELDRYLHLHGACVPGDHNTLADTLAAKAEAHWQANPKHRAKVKRNNTFGRDWLYCFMRHWLASELLPLLQSGKIPQRFANGEPL